MVKWFFFGTVMISSVLALPWIGWWCLIPMGIGVVIQVVCFWVAFFQMKAFEKSYCELHDILNQTR